MRPFLRQRLDLGSVEYCPRPYVVEEIPSAMELRPGQKLFSAVCDAEFVAVKAPSVSVEIGCGGRPVRDERGEPDGEVDASIGDAVLLGKRYADDDLGLELLCTKPGQGALTVNGQLLSMKGAKPLPSSD
jgi:hypothetical protein